MPPHKGASSFFFFACVHAEDPATESDLFGISQEVHHYLELPCTKLAQTDEIRA